MDKELYDRMAVAEKFTGESGAPVVDQQAHAALGLDWAERQHQRPEPEPVIALKPIVPMAN